nr:EOG090X036X [Eulimnadia texana]
MNLCYFFRNSIVLLPFGQGFFRRSIQQKIQYRPCTKNQQCAILRINRNRCQYCRLKKCISVGMSRDAVRFGRVPKREKAKILAAMQSVNARSAERALMAELVDDSQVMDSIVTAHVDTCDFIRSKLETLLEAAKRRPEFVGCPQNLACPLNPTAAQEVNGQQQLLQDFSERFSPAIRGVVEFAKRLPGFSFLAQDDQVTLLKAGVFEVLLVRLASMFDPVSNTMLCLNGQFLRRDAVNQTSNARFLMDSMFEFAERFNKLGLTDNEIALFCAVVVISADRPGLRNADVVDRMQSKIRTILEGVLTQSHPDRPSLSAELMRIVPDLRTLNTLHSEKSLAFKMNEHQEGGLHIRQFMNRSASPWNDSYDEGARSPMGSVSSESVCSTEMGLSDLPLLAAVAECAMPLMSQSRRKRRNAHSDHGSTSSDGEDTDLMKVSSFGIRKLESPDDSGIESGLDRYEKLSTASRSTNTSLCSSPRSSMEDKVKDVEDVVMVSSHLQLRTSTVDDMPVLKRVLQAPPLFDTNSLMDEAYKCHPHKKFRAMQRKEVAEDVTSGSSPQPSYSALAAALSSPPLTSVLPQMTNSLTSSHSTLARTLMEGPKLSLEQQRRADLIVSNIMKGTTPETPEGQACGIAPWFHSSKQSDDVHMEVSESQPLNLSLKTPEASPTRPSTPPVNQALYFALRA